ncbi:unnamed protein product [Symbiodinium sp. CCMP2592]|nr:unnamed protein product [Symbiodinium sp. CCMP2592]CAE7406072.1 unnamed protein product [Symbiodinium sp. CCMP2592]CAE7421747.1 unnamed protein product [Symbiodinium sp. CCMP2592]CAE7470487.1 unnamed protein product [Symbiodinium sp. CCMP2592]CAE7718439.1 unnamed protein product [Symbiodinium sp. CCMP2592]
MDAATTKAMRVASFLWDTVSVLHGLKAEVESQGSWLDDTIVVDMTLSQTSELQRVRYGPQGITLDPTEGQTMEKPDLLLWAIDKKKDYANMEALSEKIKQLKPRYIMAFSKNDLTQEVAGAKLQFSRLIHAAEWGVSMAGPWRAVLVFATESSLPTAATVYDAILSEAGKQEKENFSSILLGKSAYRHRKQTKASKKRPLEDDAAMEPAEPVKDPENKEEDEFSKLRGVVLPEDWKAPEETPSALEGFSATQSKNAYVMMHQIQKLPMPALMVFSSRKVLSTMASVDMALTIRQDIVLPAMAATQDSSDKKPFVREILPMEIFMAKQWDGELFNMSFVSPSTADVAASLAPMKPMLVALLVAIAAQECDF